MQYSIYVFAFEIRMALIKKKYGRNNSFFSVLPFETIGHEIESEKFGTLWIYSMWKTFIAQGNALHIALSRFIVIQVDWLMAIFLVDFTFISLLLSIAKLWLLLL